MPAPDDKADQGQQKPEGPQRLQSLSTRGGRGGLRGGRFLPNAVGRRSKEERESTAPALKPQPKEHDDQDKQKPRNKFDRRKQRQLGTRAEAAGPLSAPSIAAASAAARAARPTGTAVSAGSTGGRNSFRVKSEMDSSLALSLAADVRIDMSATGERESYIPLRMPTESVQPESVATEAEHPPQSEENENQEGQMGPVSQSHEPSAVVQAPGEAEAKLEREQMEHDHLSIDEGNMYLMQLPDLGLMVGKAPLSSPLYVPPSASTSSKKEEEVVAIKNEDGTISNPNGDNKNEDVPGDGDATMDEPTEEPIIAQGGRLGTLRKHQSGKLSLAIGDSIYEVIQGTKCTSTEEFMILNENSNRAHPLGSVKSKILVIPDLDNLHI